MTVTYLKSGMKIQINLLLKLFLKWALEDILMHYLKLKKWLKQYKIFNRKEKNYGCKRNIKKAS